MIPVILGVLIALLINDEHIDVGDKADQKIKRRYNEAE